jgi:hypothetical protein
LFTNQTLKELSPFKGEEEINLLASGFQHPLPWREPYALPATLPSPASVFVFEKVHRKNTSHCFKFAYNYLFISGRPIEDGFFVLGPHRGKTANGYDTLGPWRRQETSILPCGCH